MDNYRKNSVKLLPIIHNSNNKIIFYTEFDSLYDVGDVVYLVVNDSSSKIYSYLDSSSTLKGYKLLNKEGNKLTLDINYELFNKNTDITDTLPMDCYLTRIYISKTSVINGGIINGSVITQTIIQPNIKSTVKWKQGIIINIGSEIKNIDFDSKTTNDELILHTNLNNNKIVTKYSENNNGVGLSILNTLNNDKFNITNCDIFYGTYNNCYLSIDDGVSYSINGGYFNNCTICDGFVINGGYFKNCTFDLIKKDITWNYGTWDSNDNATGVTCTFKPLIWKDGVFVNGGISESTRWYNGRFKNGVFCGDTWFNGRFDNGTFNGNNWENGIINGGTVNNCNINGGTVNGGTLNIVSKTINACVINGGTVNNGSIQNSTINNINTVDVNITDCVINDGIFNHGTFDKNEFYNGTWNGIGGTWNGGTWYDGTVNGGTWNGGSWYNGTFNNGTWKGGTFNNGTFNNGTWNDGTWNGGVMTNPITVDYIEWYGGVFNGLSGSTFGITKDDVNWYGGSFNNGVFKGTWYDGIFYNGSIDTNSTWNGGIYYTINNIDSISPSVIPTNKKHDNIQFQPYKK